MLSIRNHIIYDHTTEFICDHTLMGLLQFHKLELMYVNLVEYVKWHTEFRYECENCIEILKKCNKPHMVIQVTASNHLKI